MTVFGFSLRLLALKPCLYRRDTLPVRSEADPSLSARRFTPRRAAFWLLICNSAAAAASAP